MAEIYKDNLLIAGMGRTGMSVADYFDSAGIEYTSCDDHAGYVSCSETIADFHGYVIKSPGISPNTLPDSKSIKIVNDVELFMRISRKPVIMVTGTNGKSTVVALLEHVIGGSGIRAVACGNNGLPVFQAMNKDVELYVLELSSYQLENMASLSCVSSVVLNIGIDHVERYSNMQEYMVVKQKVYTDSLICVYPVNRKKEIEYYTDINGYISVGDHGEVVYRFDDETIFRNDSRYCAVSELALTGNHNYLNICAVLALIEPLNLDKQKVNRLLKSFKGLPHRMEIVCQDSMGRNWVNDSKSTNVHSLRAALESQSSQVCLIAGGRGKSEDYQQLFEDFSGVVARLILFGEDARIIGEQAESISDRHIVNTLQQAVGYVGDFQGDILFSPACASFDQYSDYEARGDDFRNLARRLMSC